MADAESLIQDKDRAFRGTPAEKVALASRPDLAPELLVFLAADAAAGVRRAVAANENAPAHADRILAQDADPEVRARLARKLARRAGENEAEPPSPRQRLMADLLKRLSADPVAEVRQSLSDALADLPDAPADLVLALAFDVVAEVCEPVIRLSRLLAEADLLRLVREPPGPGSRLAVARRLQLAAELAEAIVETGDRAAILALLRNRSARMGQNTLARLLAQAEREEPLQEPLLGRGAELAPDLLERLVAALTPAVISRLVADELPEAALAALRARAAPRARPSTRVVWGSSVH